MSVKMWGIFIIAADFMIRRLMQLSVRDRNTLQRTVKKRMDQNICAGFRAIKLLDFSKISKTFMKL